MIHLKRSVFFAVLFWLAVVLVPSIEVPTLYGSAIVGIITSGLLYTILITIVNSLVLNLTVLITNRLDTTAKKALVLVAGTFVIIIESILILSMLHKWLVWFPAFPLWAASLVVILAIALGPGGKEK